MVKKLGDFYLYYNVDEQKLLVDKFGTTDKKELQKLIKQNSVAKDSTDLTDPDLQFKAARAKIANAKADRIKDKESLQLRKLEAETELLERQINYDNTFHSKPSKEAKSSMKKGIERRYNNQPSYTENISPKKNYFIEKQNYGYVGKCRVCQNFETDLCNTGYEAEGDIELHLESIHQKELYVR